MANYNFKKKKSLWEHIPKTSQSFIPPCIMFFANAQVNRLPHALPQKQHIPHYIAGMGDGQQQHDPNEYKIDNINGFVDNDLQ